jgi:curved DNA-binding protein
MKFKDYYEVMGVPRDASQDDIKKAYRKLARKFHPDVSEADDADARFKELGEAYEVLKDPEKRAAYDQLGADWKAGQDFRPPPGWTENTGYGGQGFEGFSGGSADFSDFFEDLFGRGYGGSGSGGRRPGGFQADGQDSHARIAIDIRDSYLGATRSIQLQVPEATGDGRMVYRNRSLNVKIPKGIRPGQQIRLKGQGGPAMGGGAAGDLFLEVAFREDERYQVDGADVFLTLPVAPWEAALGDKVTVPVPSGDIELKIPAGSKNGGKMRVRGKGLPGKAPGDLYVVLDVVFPPPDNDVTRKLYEQMREQVDFDPRAGLKRQTSHG